MQVHIYNDEYNLQYPLNHDGRVELEQNSNGDVEAVIYGGIDYEFPNSYTGFIDNFDYDSVMGFFDAFIEGDMNAMKVNAKKITHEVGTVTVTNKDRSAMGLSATNVERGFFDVCSLNEIAESNGCDTVEFLNPSVGTVKRASDAGMKYPIRITAGIHSISEDQYKEELDAVCDEKGWERAEIVSWEDLAEDKMYYTSFRADKAYQHDVKHFIGFELNPYVVAMNRSNLSYRETDTFIDFVIHREYTAHHRYNKRIKQYRYTPDLVADLVSRSVKVTSGNLHFFNLISTRSLKIPPRRMRKRLPVPLELEFASLVNPIVDKTGLRDVYSIPTGKKGQYYSKNISYDNLSSLQYNKRGGKDVWGCPPLIATHVRSPLFNGVVELGSKLILRPARYGNFIVEGCRYIKIQPSSYRPDRDKVFVEDKNGRLFLKILPKKKKKQAEYKKINSLTHQLDIKLKDIVNACYYDKATSTYIETPIIKEAFKITSDMITYSE